MPPRIPRLVLSLEAGAARRLARAVSTTAARPSAAAAALHAQLPPDYIPPTQPPSARRPEKRQAQLIRSYTAMLRSTPLLLLFQHNNLTAVEWMAVRRELRSALEKVSPGAPAGDDVAENVKMEVLRVRMFDVAMRITSFFDAEAARADESTPRSPRHGPLVHDLSLAAYRAAKDVAAAPPPDSAYAQLRPLLTGPLAALTFPAVSPPHLAACLSVLAPGPAFPAPSRSKNPGYHEPIVQNALSKLLLVGGRVEGRVFDRDGVEWVGGIEGGMDGLRARLVSMLQGVGMGVTSTLEGAQRSLWFALEGRREQLEGKGKDEGDAKE